MQNLHFEIALKAQKWLFVPSFFRIGIGATLRLIFATWCVAKGIVRKLRCLPDSAVAVEQTAEEGNLLNFAGSILSVWQNHIAVKPCVGAIVIPVFQVFFHGKSQLPFIGKYDIVQALCLYCPDKVFHPRVHHRSKWRQFLYFDSDRLKNHIKANPHAVCVPD